MRVSAKVRGRVSVEVRVGAQDLASRPITQLGVVEVVMWYWLGGRGDWLLCL